MKNQRRSFLIAIGLLSGVGLVFCCGVIGVINFFESRPIGEGTLNVESISNGGIGAFYMNSGRDQIVYMHRDAGERILRSYNVDRDQTEDLLVLDQGELESPYNLGTFIISQAGNAYFPVIQMGQGFANGGVVVFDLAAGREIYAEMLQPASSYDREGNFHVDKNDLREAEANSICERFLNGAVAPQILEFDDAQNDQFFIDTASRSAIMQYYCSPEQASRLRSTSNTITRVERTAQVTFSEEMIADRENDVEILLTNKRCSKGCSYDFEITYGDESFLLEQTVIYFSQTGHLLDKNGGLILANKGELYRLTKP